jgi:hypothetical protein
MNSRELTMNDLITKAKREREDLAETINEEHQAADQCLKAANKQYGAALRHAKAAGDGINEAHTKIIEKRPEWLKKNCPDISDRTARVYKQIAQNWDVIEPKLLEGSIRSIDSALDLIKAPKQLPAPKPKATKTGIDKGQSLNQPLVNRQAAANLQTTGNEQESVATDSIDKTPDSKPVQQAVPPIEVPPVQPQAKPKPGFTDGIYDETTEDDDEAPNENESLREEIEKLKREIETLKQTKKPYYENQTKTQCTECQRLRSELETATAKIAKHFNAMRDMEQTVKDHKEYETFWKDLRKHTTDEQWEDINNIIAAGKELELESID